jgi:hypothetical protein
VARGFRRYGEQSLDAGHDRIIGALAVGKGALPVLDLARTVETDQNGYPMLGDEGDLLLIEQSAVGRRMEFDFFVRGLGFSPGVGHHGPHQGEVEERLPAEESDVDLLHFP